MLAPLGTAAAAEGAVDERDVDFDGGIAAAVENLAAVNVDDRAHTRMGLGTRDRRDRLSSATLPAVGAGRHSGQFSPRWLGPGRGTNESEGFDWPGQ